MCVFNILLLLQNGRIPEVLGMDSSIGVAKDSLSNLQSIAKGHLLKL